MGCGVYWQQIHVAEKALTDLERLGLGPGTPAYETVFAKRGELLTEVGRKFPRIDYSLAMWEDFSPERMRVWFDPEFGFVVEVRTGPKAPSMYKVVPAEEAAAVIKREVSPELHIKLLAPDVYLGE